MIDHEEIHEIAGEIFSRDERKFLELYKKNQKDEQEGGRKKSVKKHRKK